MQRLHRSLSCLIASAVLATAAQAAVTVLPGSDNQTTRIWAGFPNPIRIAVTDDATGQPVPGARVNLTFPWGGQFGGSGPVVCCFLNDLGYLATAVTDENGIATPLLYGASTGTSRLDVSAGYDPATLRSYGSTTLTVSVSNAPPPAQVVNLTSSAAMPGGQNIPDALRVQVLDTAGSPIPYAVVGMYLDRNVRDGTFAVSGKLGPAAEEREYGSKYVANAEGIASVAFTPALAKPTAREAGAGKVGGGSVIAYSGYASSVSIPYSVTSAAAGVPTVLQDLWWGGPAENGWGLSIIEHPGEGEDGLPQLFVVLFIYEPGGEPVWYVMSSGAWRDGYGSTWTAFIHRPRGAPFHSYDWLKHRLGDMIGTLELKFVGASGIEMNAGFWNNSFEPGSTPKKLSRLDFSGGAPSPRAGISDMWWGGNQQLGWGVAIHENLGNVFSVWFTYNDGGSPVWLVMPNGSWTDANTFAGPIFKPTGPKWIGTPYDASKHRIDALGEFSLRFGAGTPASQAALQYRVGPYNGTLDLTRLPF